MSVLEKKVHTWIGVVTSVPVIVVDITTLIANWMVAGSIIGGFVISPSIIGVRSWDWIPWSDGTILIWWWMTSGSFIIVSTTTIVFAPISKISIVHICRSLPNAGLRFWCWWLTWECGFPQISAIISVASPSWPPLANTSVFAFWSSGSSRSLFGLKREIFIFFQKIGCCALPLKPIKLAMTLVSYEEKMWVLTILSV